MQKEKVMLIIVVVFVTCRLSLSGINELTFCFCFELTMLLPTLLGSIYYLL